MRQSGMAKELEVPSERRMVFKPGITIQDQSAVDAARICTGAWNEPGVRQDTDATGLSIIYPIWKRRMKSTSQSLSWSM